jgi:pyruvate/2-oxoglutarate/acetoin dehydrogenase E1 component
MKATLEVLGEEMARDKTIFVLGEGIGKRGGNFKTTEGSTTALARSACATRLFASAASRGWPAGRP